MNDPNFFVVGAGRCGTTSLHHLIGQHPDVFVRTPKSPNFFASHIAQPTWETPVARAMASRWVSDETKYRSLFDGVTDERAIGDVSPVYLQATDISRRLHEAHPDAKIIAILRDPIERAHAHFLGRRRDGIETCSTFEQRVNLERSAPLPDEVAFGHLLGCGRYHHFLADYVRRFGAAQVKVLLYEDFLRDPTALLSDIFSFLDVDAEFRADVSTRLNRTGIIAHRPTRELWTRSARLRTALRPRLPAGVRHAIGRRVLADIDRPELDPALRRSLVPIFESDIRSLEVVIDRDLSHWLSA